jgi:hypothetical protein
MISKILSVLMLIALCCVTVQVATGLEQLDIAKQMRFMHFLEDDMTNLNKYDAGEYNCLDYAMNLWENATKEGYELALVNIAPCKQFPDGHYCVAYQTSATDWVLIEPQSDVSWNDALVKDGQDEEIVMFAMTGFTKVNQSRININPDAVLAIAII